MTSGQSVSRKGKYMTRAEAQASVTSLKYKASMSVKFEKLAWNSFTPAFYQLIERINYGRLIESHGVDTYKQPALGDDMEKGLK